MTDAELVMCLATQAVHTLCAQRRPGIHQLRDYPAWFAPRGQVEEDDRFVQVIPYIVLSWDGCVLSYQRVGGGEARLRGRRSIGFGGLINLSDAVLCGDQLNVIDSVRRSA